MSGQASGSKGGGKNRKYGRGKKHQCGVYRSMARDITNAKRRLRRHLRNHPHDETGIAHYQRTFGAAFDRNNLTSQGRRRA